ncbi:hypothetical protein EV666_103177 [Camelimonas lactis]|uniref:Uncharacterized protein n=1 Tax=Camelimonas lactis TaxID=659006 RepID=A0A4R2GV21_9HYPH|nr:hypothetical protein EV666_103177 [Camelimonas lactis]
MRSLASQALTNHVQLLQGAVTQPQLTLVAVMRYPDAGAQNVFQNLLQSPCIGILRRPGTNAAGRRLLALLGLLLRYPFGIAYIQAILDNLPGYSLWISHSQQRPGMTRGQVAIVDQFLN